MENILAREIKDYILAENPNTFRFGYSLFRLLQNGKVGLYENIIGLTDTKDNYFYIRYRDDSTVNAPTDRTTSCLEYEVETPMRLLAWVNNGNPHRLQEVLFHDLVNTTYSGLSTIEKRLFTKIYQIEVEEIIINHERIYNEETLQTKIKLNSKAALAVIDFKLKFNYKPYVYPALCLDRNICQVC